MPFLWSILPRARGGAHARPCPQGWALAALTSLPLREGYFRIRRRSVCLRIEEARAGGCAGLRPALGPRCSEAAQKDGIARLRATGRGLCLRRLQSTSRRRARSPSMMVRDPECRGGPPLAPSTCFPGSLPDLDSCWIRASAGPQQYSAGGVGRPAGHRVMKTFTETRVCDPLVRSYFFAWFPPGTPRYQASPAPRPCAV